MKNNPTPRIGIDTKNTEESLASMLNAISSEAINITGPLINILIIIIYANCTLVTSVVNLVIKLDVENLSIFSNE